MKKASHNVVITLSVLTLISLVVSKIYYQRSHVLKPEDLFTSNMTNSFSKIEFVGQRRHVVVTNEIILRTMAEAFKQPQDRGLFGGSTYDAFIYVKNESIVRVGVYIYKSMDGYSVGIPYRSGLLVEDLYYNNVRFSAPIDPRLIRLFEALNNDGNVGKTITF